MIYSLHVNRDGEVPDLITPGVLYRGPCSTFGGPNDTGVSMTEGLALVEWSDVNSEDWKHMFLPRKMGLARALNPDALYCAMRWDYTKTPRKVLRTRALVQVEHKGKMLWVRPVDWGPNIHTGRIIDLSPGALFQLGAKTDSLVNVKLVISPDTATSCG